MIVIRLDRLDVYIYIRCVYKTDTWTHRYMHSYMVMTYFDSIPMVQETNTIKQHGDIMHETKQSITEV